MNQAFRVAFPQSFEDRVLLEVDGKVDETSPNLVICSLTSALVAVSIKTGEIICSSSDYVFIS